MPQRINSLFHNIAAGVGFLASIIGIITIFSSTLCTTLSQAVVLISEWVLATIFALTLHLQSRKDSKITGALEQKIQELSQKERELLEQYKENQNQQERYIKSLTDQIDLLEEREHKHIGLLDFLAGNLLGERAIPRDPH